MQPADIVNRSITKVQFKSGESLMLRPFDYEDLPSIMEMVEKIPMFEWRLETFRTCMSAPYECWLAEHEEPRSDKVGFVIFNVFGSSAEINNLCVNSAFQGRGYGEALMFYALDRARSLGAENVTLEVRVSNSPAQSLYRKLGFQQIGVLRDYYTTEKSTEDAFVMKLQMDSVPE